MKIDRAFVDGITRTASDLALVRAILSLAESLGLHAVAEGIESEAQRAALLGLGCRLGQGYLFARPLTASQFTDLLRHADRSRLPHAGTGRPELQLVAGGR